MGNTIGNKSSVKSSAAKTLGKPPFNDKNFGLEPTIRFNAIDDIDEIQKVEEVEIIVVYDSSLASSKQNLIKRQYPYIYTFNQKGPIVIRAMGNITVRAFDHIEITSHMDVDKRLDYMQRIFIEAALKKYREVLVTFRQSAKELTGH